MSDERSRGEILQLEDGISAGPPTMLGKFTKLKGNRSRVKNNAENSGRVLPTQSIGSRRIQAAICTVQSLHHGRAEDAEQGRGTWFSCSYQW